MREHPHTLSKVTFFVYRTFRILRKETEMLNKHTTKFVKKLDKRLNKVQKDLTLVNLIHVLLLTVILLVISQLFTPAKKDANKWSVSDIAFVIYFLYYLIVDIMGNLN